MKYMLKSLLIIASFLCCLSNINASSTCASNTIKELSSLATYVKVSYEVIDNSEYKTLSDGKNETQYKIPNYTFNITIYNISKELYVDVIDNTTDETMHITNSMTTEDNYTFSNSDFGVIHNYSFQVKSAISECPDKSIRTLKLTIPRYNAYSEFNYCKNSSSYYCQKFVGTELNIANLDDFYKKISSNNKSPVQEEITEEKIMDLVKQNWLIYLITFVIVAVFAIIVLFLLTHKKKRGSKL